LEPQDVDGFCDGCRWPDGHRWWWWAGHRHYGGRMDDDRGV
jgi:hypothetical protein